MTTTSPGLWLLSTAGMTGLFGGPRLELPVLWWALRRRGLLEGLQSGFGAFDRGVDDVTLLEDADQRPL